MKTISRKILADGISILRLVCDVKFCLTGAEVRRLVHSRSLLLNDEEVTDCNELVPKDLDQITFQKGKKLTLTINIIG